MRDRLIEILLDGVTFTDEYKFPARKQAEYVADRLLANGVIVQKEGRWKGAGMGDYYCSLCCETYTGGNEYKFCPNCGAKMS